MNTTDQGSERAFPGSAHAADPEADCEKVASVLDKVEAGDATSAEVNYLIDHAQGCSPCFQSIDKQRLFIAFLQGSLRQKGVPTELANAIRATIEREVAAA